MDSLQRIYKLHQVISSSRHPVSCQTLQDKRPPYAGVRASQPDHSVSMKGARYGNQRNY